MFWVRWAYKNIIMNMKRAGGKIFFISLVLMIVGMGLMFLEGTNLQIKSYLRNTMGDLVSTSRGIETNILPVYDYLNQKYSSLIEASVRTYRTFAEFLGNTVYATGSLIGAEPSFFSYLDSCVSWLEPPEKKLTPGTALIEYYTASKLNLRRGDSFSIRVKTEDGMINTLQVRVEGIFLGSDLLFEKVIYINISDLEHLLIIGEEYAGEVKTYFRENASDEELIALHRDLVDQFSGLALFQLIRLHPAAAFIYQEFQYYRMIMILLFIVITIVFLFIIYFAVQNSFFISYKARRNEIITLLTYGMKPQEIMKIALWESLLIFCIALFIASVLSWCLGLILQTVIIDNPESADLISIIGGPRLHFSPSLLTLGIFVGIILLITIYAANKGVGVYLRGEIREILTGM